MSLIGQIDRRALISATAGLALAGGGQAWAQPAAPAAMRCADFLDGIGVNTHVGYADSQYGPERSILAAMDYIGVRHARDVAINPGQPSASHYRALAAAGVRFCLFWGVHRTMAEAIGHVGALEAQYPGSVAALEGPNEIKPGFSWNGLAGNAAGQAFMTDLRRVAGADPRLNRKPVVNYTSYAPVAADCDFANQHPYPKGGRQPAAIIRQAHDEYVGPRGVMPGKPMMFTEFGYHTLVSKPARQGRWQGVDEDLQASLLINGLLDAVSLGVSRTYIYQLLDGYADGAAAPDQERHFGLFRFDGSPKPAATALKALFTVLADSSPGARAFAPAPVAAVVEADGPVRSLSFRNAQGRAFVALWNETQVWDVQAAARLAVTPTTVTVKMSGAAPVRQVDLVDPAQNRAFPPSSATRVAVGAHPTILAIG
jgi:hypothetical protein